jgi:hypothetical protein
MTTRWEYKVLTFQLGWKGFDYAAMEREDVLIVSLDGRTL